MRISGAGRESLMVIVPMAVAFGLAVVFNGGPMPLLDRLDRGLADVFHSVYEWARNVL